MQITHRTLSILFVYLGHERSTRIDREIAITEMWQLVETLGNAQVVDLIHQKGKEHEATYIGPGKIQEVIEYLSNNSIDIVICNGNLKPSQKFALLQLFWNVRPTIIIWDRIDLILAIFSKHAQTTEAKLQIKLAQMKNMGPRIFGMGKILSRQGGGIGTRGIGETNTELMQRHWQREIGRVTAQLAKVAASRKSQMDHRKKLGFKTISIVGYTNAGKTSLFNILTHKDHRVENELFATLDSTVGDIYLPSIGKKVLISDTIGFIANLPPALIDAFTSTLTESIHADVILHVIDVSDAMMSEKIQVVDTILHTLHIRENKVILVFNKIDAAAKLDREALAKKAEPQPYVFLSTKTKEGIEQLVTSVLPTLI